MPIATLTPTPTPTTPTAMPIVTSTPTLPPTTILTTENDSCKIPRYIYDIISVLSVYSFVSTLAFKVVFILYRKKHGDCCPNARSQVESVELSELSKPKRTASPNVYSLPPIQNSFSNSLSSLNVTDAIIEIK
jgi:hypothetical protein